MRYDFSCPFSYQPVYNPEYGPSELGKYINPFFLLKWFYLWVLNNPNKSKIIQIIMDIVFSS